MDFFSPSFMLQSILQCTLVKDVSLIVPNKPKINARARKYRVWRNEIEPIRFCLGQSILKFRHYLGCLLLRHFLGIHSTGEVYLGQRETIEWTKDEETTWRFKKFGQKLGEIEERIILMNNDPQNWKTGVDLLRFHIHCCILLVNLDWLGK